MKTETPPRKLETRLIHGSGAPGEEGATLPPLYFSTAFEHESAADMESVLVKGEPGYVYSRLQNPTVAELERRVTDATGALGTLAVASGMSAITLGLLALVEAGDEIIAGQYLFGGTFTLMERTLRDLGVKTHFIDPRFPEEAATRFGPKTRLVFLETIANPAMVVPDFAAYRELCDAHDVPLLVDATLLTPSLYDAATIGADIAFFSASKHIAGPASTLGGLVVDFGRHAWEQSPRFADFKRAGRGALLASLRSRLMAGVGPCLSPMNAFLLLLGLETLPLRMERHGRNAGAAAVYLREHPRVKEVLFPGLPDNEFHQVAREQFHGNYGGVICFRLENRAACFRFLDALKLVKRAVNLGDTKCIALHPASTIYGTFWPGEQEQLGVTEDLIRFSVGLEHPADIIADLDQALRA